MTTIVISPTHVAAYPQGGGHFWVYMQYALGLQALGCDVYWLEEVRGDDVTTAPVVRAFLERMAAFGLGKRTLLYSEGVTDMVAHATATYALPIMG